MPEFGNSIQGRRQAVRQQVLILPCVGSNPAAPAINPYGLRVPISHSSKTLQGRRQAVRQQVLILPCVGSNPATPAIFSTSLLL